MPESQRDADGVYKFEKICCWFRHCDVESDQAEMHAGELSIMDRLFKNIENQL